MAFPPLFNPFPNGFRLIDGSYLNKLFGGNIAISPAIAAGSGGSTVNPEGVLSVNTTSTGNGADTTEDTLLTYTLPAKTLIGTKGLKIRAWGNTAANADNKTVKLYFGTNVITTPTAATSGKGWELELEVFRTGTSTQVVFGSGVVDVTPVTPLVTTGAQTDTGAIVIKVTGTAGTANANDIVAKGLIVEMLN
jgi:hypothetical protein